jgi:osmotically inducible protein OsmC
MAKRKASAVWEGKLREGKGAVALGSVGVTGQYSFASMFESGTATNPEEMIGAAHAACRMFFDGPGGGIDEGRV